MFVFNVAYSLVSVLLLLVSLSQQPTPYDYAFDIVPEKVVLQPMTAQQFVLRAFSPKPRQVVYLLVLLVDLSVESGFVRFVLMV